MNKNKFTFLIAGSSVSILFLIAFQVYWVKTSVKAQQQLFDQRVMDVMHEVINKIEREEAITEVTSKILDTESLSQNQTLDSTFSFSPIEKKSVLEINSSPSQNSASAPYSQEQLNIQFKRPKRTDSSVFIIRETKKRVLNSNVYLQNIQGDSLLQNQIKRKATIINEIVNELAFISITNNFNERIDRKHIDSLLNFELLDQGINADYVFDIFDAETKSLSFEQDPDLSQQIKNSKYKVSLFENDFLIDSDTLLLYFPEQNNYIIKNSWEVLLISILLVSILILFFYSSLKTILNQKRLSQVKNDFINNMTHELKTPISTISLACEALKDRKISIDDTRRENYVEIINDENSRLSLLVDNVLKSAVWDSNSLRLNYEKVNIHPIIQKVVDSFKIQLEKKSITLKLELNANIDLWELDQIHFSNIIFNLVDNAFKYSPANSSIIIKTENYNNQLWISVIDYGIGISIQNQKRIFDKFYRVSTGNIHDVKGFGLGLNYVKNMVNQFGGEIILKSKEGKGTSITIKLLQNE